MNTEAVTIVSGLPRSGTSMMMRMLEAGGMKLLTDNIRKANEDNPEGYYEFEKVKMLDKDNSWIIDARGKSVKIISALLEHLPEKQTYKIIFMHRKMEELLDSQRQMLIRRGEPTDTVSDDDMKKMFLKHLGKVKKWLERQTNIDVIYILYNEVLKDSVGYSEKINNFLGNRLDVNNMVQAVNKKLYRQRIH